MSVTIGLLTVLASTGGSTTNASSRKKKVTYDPKDKKEKNKARSTRSSRQCPVESTPNEDLAEETTDNTQLERPAWIHSEALVVRSPQLDRTMMVMMVL